MWPSATLPSSCLFSLFLSTLFLSLPTLSSSARYPSPFASVFLSTLPATLSPRLLRLLRLLRSPRHLLHPLLLVSFFLSPFLFLCLFRPSAPFWFSASLLPSWHTSVSGTHTFFGLSKNISKNWT